MFYANYSTTVSGSSEESEVQFNLGARAWNLEGKAVAHVLGKKKGGVFSG